MKMCCQYIGRSRAAAAWTHAVNCGGETGHKSRFKYVRRRRKKSGDSLFTFCAFDCKSNARGLNDKLENVNPLKRQNCDFDIKISNGSDREKSSA